jgi:hypothetical protein
VAGETVGHARVVHLADLGGVELGRGQRALLDRAASEAISLGLVATQGPVLEVAVPDRAVDDVLRPDRGGGVGHPAQRDEEGEARDYQCW